MHINHNKCKIVVGRCCCFLDPGQTKKKKSNSTSYVLIRIQCDHVFLLTSIRSVVVVVVVVVVITDVVSLVVITFFSYCRKAWIGFHTLFHDIVSNVS